VNLCHGEFMNLPKQRYPRSVAQALRPQPCPDCQRMSPRRYQVDPHSPDEVDPDVLVAWYCPNNLCHKSRGFWIESR
jgi:hypothetical protein